MEEASSGVKLSLSAGAGEPITAELVGKMVGTWRTKTAWQMLEAALAGNVGDALGQLDRLLLAGEHPVAILAQISSNLRRFAAATRVILQDEAAGRRPVLRRALETAGASSIFEITGSCHTVSEPNTTRAPQKPAKTLGP